MTHIYAWLDILSIPQNYEEVRGLPIAVWSLYFYAEGDGWTCLSGRKFEFVCLFFACLPVVSARLARSPASGLSGVRSSCGPSYFLPPR